MSPFRPSPAVFLVVPLAAACLVMSLGNAWAQEADPPAAAPDTPARWLAQADPLPPPAPPPPGPRSPEAEAARFAAGELAGHRVVKGAPYCADAVHETVQWLADPAGGPPNRIVRQQTSRLCRDGEGRTRQEVTHGTQRRVYLHDPVARESWVLDPAARQARRLLAGGPPVPVPPPEAEAWRDYADRMRDWSRQWLERLRGHGAGAVAGQPAAAAPGQPVPPVPPAVMPAPPLAPSPVLLQPAAGDGAPREVELRIVRLAAQPGAEPPPLPPGLGQRAGGLAPRGPGVTTALPARELEGLRVDGERTTWTIEAGRIGNERPIVISREVWRSPELLLVVQSRDVDPRSGETVYRLANLRRGEPDPALMRVPADYQQRPRPAVPPAGPAAPASPAARGQG